MSKQAPDQRTPVERIRNATRDEHARAEQHLESRFFDDSTIAPEQFRQLLRRFYGLYVTLDEPLADADRWLDEFSYRRRAPRLRDDLCALGHSEAALGEIPPLPESKLPRFDTPDRLLGGLYVVEGSELGSLELRDRMETCLDDDQLRADAFFHGQSRKVAARWQTFQTVFNDRITAGAPLDRATDTARATFELFTGWFR